MANQDHIGHVTKKFYNYFKRGHTSKCTSEKIFNFSQSQPEIQLCKVCSKFGQNENIFTAAKEFQRTSN